MQICSTRLGCDSEWMGHLLERNISSEPPTASNESSKPTSNGKKKPNFSGNETPIDFLVPNEKTNLRLHVGWKVNRNLELRTRAEHVWWDEQKEENSRGFLIYQDILFKPIKLPFSFTARYAWFSTDDYDSRIYTYENDLIYNFSIPAYADHGSRYYINMRYDINRLITAEARIAQTAYRNRETISSGNEKIEGSKKTDVKIQIRLRF